ncbi:NAD-dependent epimerase/dehydratase family protein [Aquitalea aquatica]|uniref:NAD-dependent epimerase/dehydratase family protein n=1 Tax=Aquitalea aquatica TaxID=3044273 RepID=A0A838XWP9_9NEIS|nr:NAD-dependent epimerase/dehydratase family protein [Aquitalea magnusonii]MBA4706816.1 NAD-dependent epimerase/dehydratase family protein [Aquitalea magnusonii]
MSKAVRRIAISGASGFIGQHVLAALQHGDDEIVALCRDPARLQQWQPRVEVLQLDHANPPADAYEQMGRPDVLLHLAWQGLPNYQSLHHFEQELPRQYAFLSQLIAQGLPALVVAGTCFEYGLQSGALSVAQWPQPATPYALAKHVLHQQLCFLAQQTGVALSWARLFYMHGSGQPPQTLWSQLEAAVARGETRFNMSGGEQLRDYLPVGEVARQLLMLTRTPGQPALCNICSGQPVSVRRLVEGWIAEQGWNIDLNLGHYPYPQHEPMAFWGVPARFGPENI